MAKPVMDVRSLTVTELVRLLGSGALTATDIARQLADRVEAGEYLNAFIHTDLEALITAARAFDRQAPDVGRKWPLLGVPLAIKDNIDVAGWPTSAGTAALKDHVARRSTVAVDRLLEAGALVAGKANMHELAFGITTNNAIFGAARNPYDPTCIPGGSSGGVAVAIAAHMVPAGLGTDTGGSVRIPAALCGIVGLRPTIGRYPAGGVVPISHTRDTIGPMARTVADLALLDGIITQTKPELDAVNWQRIRLGVPRAPFYRDLHPDTERAMTKTLALLDKHGATLVEIDMSDVVELAEAVGLPLCLYEVMRDLPAYLAAGQAACTLEQIIDEIGSADVRALFEIAAKEGAVTDRDYQSILHKHRPTLQRAYQKHFASNRLDAVVFPTTPLPACLIGEDETTELNGRQVPTFATYIRNTDPASNAGLPGISIPIALSAQGLPIGMELDGPAGTDRALLSLATALEVAIGPVAPPPALGTEM